MVCLPTALPQVFRDPDGMLTRLVRSLAAGIILALALVHIVPGERAGGAGVSGRGWGAGAGGEEERARVGCGGGKGTGCLRPVS